MTNIQQILGLLSGVHGTSGRWMAKCPAHEDRLPSLSITDAKDRVLMRCHAGCTIEQITGAIGITISSLFDGTIPRVTEKKLTAKQEFAKWREEKLVKLAGELRQADFVVSWADSWHDAGMIPDDAAMKVIGAAYQDYSRKEYEFEILRTGTTAQALEIYRRGA